MKTIAALIAGLLLSMTTFVAGLVIALVFLNAGEQDHPPGGQDTATLWTTEPVDIDKSAQTFERLPARPPLKEHKVAALRKAGVGARAIKSAALEDDPAVEPLSLDPTTTGTIEAQPAMDTSRRTWRSTAHADWCARRYRSYDPTDNSYRPYGGGRRTCESPYSTAATAEEPTHPSRSSEPVTAMSEEQPTIEDDLPSVDRVSLANASDAASDSEEHIRSCFARYRSYRPEDNSYQPFDGGPRRQCR